jgi:uncharacterized Zn-binding protein involved in type VI secretion
MPEQLAARLTDKHICPAVTANVPHAGGLILPPCCKNVFIQGLNAARVGDSALCVSGPPAAIVKGSGTVYIGGSPAARLTDATAHGGKISSACTSVFIGD